MNKRSMVNHEHQLENNKTTVQSLVNSEKQSWTNTVNTMKLRDYTELKLSFFNESHSQ